MQKMQNQILTSLVQCRPAAECQVAVALVAVSDGHVRHPTTHLATSESDETLYKMKQLLQINAAKR